MDNAEFGWGERELEKEVAFIFMFFVLILSKAHFMMSRGLLFTFLLKLLIFACKAENLVAFLLYILYSSHLWLQNHTNFFLCFALPVS